MSIFTTLALRLFGLSGIIGSILFIVGDLLINHIPDSNDSNELRLSKISESRLLNGGTLGLIGCWFYTLAAFHLYIAFRPAGDAFAFMLSLAFGATMICYGIAHAAYIAIPAGAQVAAKLGSDPESGGRLGWIFFLRLVNITYIPVAIFSLMMLYGIATGHSMYPRWMVVFLPIILYLLRAPVMRIFKGQLKEVIGHAYDNIILFVFFVLSTVILWNGLGS